MDSAHAPSPSSTASNGHPTDDKTEEVEAEDGNASENERDLTLTFVFVLNKSLVTKATPPRSIWQHPYDDESYMSTLSSEQRERIQEEERQRRIDEHCEDESKRPSSSGRSPGRSAAGSSYDQELPPRPSKSEDHSKLGFGEKMKQKLTGQTKEEREEYKRQRDEEE
ncbi:hypothetical protein LTR24_009974 [Lithohypha guttulata]|uniref:Uncharacterized protein n=1 Tax=Lithohypha guttulata TaxID=1690604 RepID=A0ABR0JW29_9EURO|nr:hypothetical protein LTR24_009974 [Lithohypha guttulata]